MRNSWWKHFSTHARPVNVIIPAEINDIIDVITDKNPYQPSYTIRSIKVYRAHGKTKPRFIHYHNFGLMV